MEFFQIYAKEIFSLFVPLFTWFLNSKLREKAKLNLGRPHSFTFLVNQPLLDNDGGVIRERQTAHTESHVLTNSGKQTATKVEVVFNWKPECINIWPSRHFVEHVEADHRYVMIFDSLAPNEVLGIEVLSVNADPPALITARSDQCVANMIDMYPQPVVKPWIRRVAVTLLFAGFSFFLYISILLLQFLLGA